jgi:hypothetical protein
MLNHLITLRLKAPECDVGGEDCDIDSGTTAAIVKTSNRECSS